MPRIDPDRIELDGLHTDYYWPGEIHSVWKSKKWFELRRERKYNRPGAAGRLVQVNWQVTFRFGRHTFGWRWEKSYD